MCVATSDDFNLTNMNLWFNSFLVRNNSLFLKEILIQQCTLSYLLGLVLYSYLKIQIQYNKKAHCFTKKV